MMRHSLIFAAPGQMEIRTEPLAPPGLGEVLVQAELSAISPGTELLCYRGQLPTDQPLDMTITVLRDAARYPLKYGYSMVGRVAELGGGVEPAWLGRRVFAFHPHETAFLAPLTGLLLVPENVSAEDAIFLPNIETALNFVLDAAPLIGEDVLVFGQGVVGLLTAALLRHFPLRCLAALDAYPLRREASLALGLDACLDPAQPDMQAAVREMMPEGADLSIEVSGAPRALEQAIACTGFAGRVLVGSWYGTKPVTLDLGGSFHRSRIRLISSQVSTIDPALSGRWDKDRRFELAWRTLARLKPSRWITHVFPLERAAQAYALIDQNPAETIQVTLKYPFEVQT